MSVTFTAATRTFVAEFNAEVLMSCPEAEDLEANMSNANAAVVCGALGIDLEEWGWCGSLPAEDFLGRVLLALAIQPADEGIPVHETTVPGQVRWIECGRRPGYIQERLAQLHDLAQWAVAHDAEIGRNAIAQGTRALLVKVRHRQTQQVPVKIRSQIVQRRFA